MKKSELETILLDFKQTQHLAAIFKIAAGSTARGAISYRDGYIQAQVFHGVDLKDVATFTYDAPGIARRPAAVRLTKTYQTFDPTKTGGVYTFTQNVSWGHETSVLLDHNGRQNPLPYDRGRNIYHARQVQEMQLILAEYAMFHRNALEIYQARAKETPPSPGQARLKLVSHSRSL